jgi:hypothetical protein
MVHQRLPHCAARRHLNGGRGGLFIDHTGESDGDGSSEAAFHALAAETTLRSEIPPLPPNVASQGALELLHFEVSPDRDRSRMSASTRATDWETSRRRRSRTYLT